MDGLEDDGDLGRTFLTEALSELRKRLSNQFALSHEESRVNPSVHGVPRWTKAQETLIVYRPGVQNENGLYTFHL